MGLEVAGILIFVGRLGGFYMQRRADSEGDSSESEHYNDFNKLLLRIKFEPELRNAYGIGVEKMIEKIENSNPLKGGG